MYKSCGALTGDHLWHIKIFATDLLYEELSTALVNWLKYLWTLLQFILSKLTVIKYRFTNGLFLKIYIKIFTLSIFENL